MNKERLYTLIPAVVFLSVCAWIFFFALPKDVESATDTLLHLCASESDRSVCYEQRAPTLLESMSLEEVFSVVRLLRHKDPAYQFCHVLAHKLGERIVAEDPERWLDAIALNPRDGLCSNGFIHGVIGGKFRAEVLEHATLEGLLPDFSRACEPRENWHASLLDQAMCYHGMGHLYVFITDADIPAALSLCERTSESPSGDFRRVCREGVFMQIYQPLEPDDFLMLERMEVKPTKETVRTYCARFEEDAYEGACLRESWPYVRTEILESSGAIDAFCSGQPNSEEERACYDSALSVLGRQTLGNGKAASSVCAGFTGMLRRECFGRVALSYLEEEREDGVAAFSFCSRAGGADGEECLAFLAERAAFVFGADEVRLWKFCMLLPASMRNVCMTDPQRITPLSGVVHTQ